LSKQKSATVELRTRLSRLADRLTQSAKELMVKNQKIYRLVYHIKNLQLVLYHTLHTVWEDCLTKPWRSEDT